MDAKADLLNEIRHRIHHHPSLSSTDIRVADGDGRVVAFDLVDASKYALRSELIDDFTHTTHYGHDAALVVETFTTDRVTAVPVDTTAYEATVNAFIRERDERRPPCLEDYRSLDLVHVEALEQWGAVNRLHEIDAKHVHDAFHEYHRLDADIEVDFTT